MLYVTSCIVCWVCFLVMFDIYDCCLFWWLFWIWVFIMLVLDCVCSWVLGFVILRLVFVVCYCVFVLSGCLTCFGWCYYVLCFLFSDWCLIVCIGWMFELRFFCLRVCLLAVSLWGFRFRSLVLELWLLFIWFWVGNLLGFWGCFWCVFGGFVRVVCSWVWVAYFLLGGFRFGLCWALWVGLTCCFVGSRGLI